jgi:putative membrane protein
MVLYSLSTGFLALGMYQYLGWKWVAIPWLPISLIGTAVAFYVGFKNNQSYDRCWEARKVWGGITNLSRAFGSAARAYVTADFAGQQVPQEEVDREIRILIYRHLAWLCALKHSMRQRMQWEHENTATLRQRRYFDKRMDFSSFEKEASACLSEEEMAWVMRSGNRTTQLLDLQSQHLADLKRRGLLDDFRHMELQRFITDLFAEQGASERIKRTPLPRQYSTSSAIFIVLFTFLLPFGMLHEFQQIGDGMIWLLIPFNMVVSWVFSLMEYTGDYSENPFEGLINDVPILSIARNIEIGLKEMMGEESLPERLEPHLDVLF